jgi:hypothetical protein
LSAPKSRCPDCFELTVECSCPGEDDGLYQIGDGDGYHGAEGLELLRVPVAGPLPPSPAITRESE